MKVVINGQSLLSKKTGIGNFTYNIAQTFRKNYPQDEFMFYYGFFTKKLFSTELQRGLFVNNYLRLLGLARKFPFVLVLYRFLKTLIRGLDNKKMMFDIYFEPNFIPEVHKKARRTIVTVFDFSFMNRDWTPKDRYFNFKKRFWASIKNADIIVTSSEYVRKEAIRILKIEPKQVKKIFLAVDHEIFNTRTTDIEAGIKLPKRYILYVGSIQPRKNLVGLLDAYLALPLEIRHEYKLLLVGFDGWQNKEIVSRVKNLGNDIKVVNSVHDNNTLAEIYRRAFMFVFPSYYEGFGLPPLEAMACGCPVVVSNSSSLPEVCGKAVSYVDPSDISSIKDGMLKVIKSKSYRAGLIKKGLHRVSAYTWEKTCVSLMAIFKEALTESKRREKIKIKK